MDRMQEIRDHINRVVEASLEEPPRMAIRDLVAALRMMSDEIGEVASSVVGLGNPKCCESYPNGPQWGHEWSCPKCPD